MSATRLVHGAYRDEADMIADLARLGASERGYRVVEVRSTVPLELAGPGLATKRSWVPLWGILGGLTGGLAFFLLATFSARAYPLITGHMPIVAGPPIGIITFEGIALGAVVATTLGFILEAGLMRRLPSGPFDRVVSDGGSVVVLEADDEPAAVAELMARAEGWAEAG